MQIRCLAIDDEPLALQQLSGYITKTPIFELIASCKSAFEAMEIMDANEVDLLFVDIQMPDLTGMDFVKSLKKDVKVIFTTAYEEYALEGFKVDALDYILKPFGYEEFLKAANKANDYFSLKEKATISVDSKNDYLFVKSEYKIRKINLDNILYIEGLREYVKIHQTEGKPILSLLSMKSLLAKLPEERFMRVHRSFIVNLDKINTIERSRIVFGDVYIPISDQYKEQFQKFLNRNFI